MVMRLLAIVAGAMLVLAPAPVAACFCGPSCGSILTAEALFAATVTAIQSPASGLGERIIRLSDVRVVRGTAAPDRLVTMAGDTCGYDFKVGTRYLVDARQFQPGRFGASSCGNTRPLADAKGLLAFLAATRPELRPRLWGRVISARADQFLRTASAPSPVAGAVVTVSGPVTRAMTTSDDGDYSFAVRDLPLGTYTVSVEVPASRTDIGAPPGATVTFGPHVECASLTVAVPSTARLSGRIVDDAGRPVADVPVVIFPLPFDWWAGRIHTAAVTDAYGRYVIDALAPGRYAGGVAMPYPGVDAPYRPGRLRMRDGSDEITIAPGAAVEALPLTAVAAPRIPVPGRVVVAPDEGAAGVFVAVAALDGFPQARTAGVTTDADGHFRLELHDGVRYRIEVERGGRVVASRDIVAGRGLDIQVRVPQ